MIVLRLFGLLCVVTILGSMRIITEGASNRLGSKLQTYTTPLTQWTIDDARRETKNDLKIANKMLADWEKINLPMRNNVAYYINRINQLNGERSKIILDLDKLINAIPAPKNKSALQQRRNKSQTDWGNLNGDNAKIGNLLDTATKNRDSAQNDVKTMNQRKQMLNVLIDQLKQTSPPNPSGPTKPGVSGGVKPPNKPRTGTIGPPRPPPKTAKPGVFRGVKPPNKPTGPPPGSRNQGVLGSGSGVMQPVPGYEKYKFKGCWSVGNDTAYPVLNKMAVCGVPNISDCAKRATNLNLSTMAYDGKGMCQAGDLEYQTKTPTECYNTYGQGKSWSVYSTK